QTNTNMFCLTPTRYLWSGYREYLDNPPKKLSWIPFYRYVSQPFLGYAKAWDKIASQRPDTYVAISEAVQERIKKYYQRDSLVIHPPVDINRFTKLNSDVKKRDYYLIVSRLVPYKKIDLAVKVFNEIGYPLIIVGTGSEEKKLKKIAKKNVEFKGFVDEKNLIELYQNAKAFIHPQDEDFGITAVEAQGAGVPVIAYKKGGALDTVVDGKTGIFFEEQTRKGLLQAIRSFENMKFESSDLTKNAQKFSNIKFKKEFLKLVSQTLDVL
ncbi:glycosyltransferase, partial [Patescibacteria group bacterium]|nr:glycosyltransferase [Patescibacteria group bacterium]